MVISQIKSMRTMSVVFIVLLIIALFMSFILPEEKVSASSGNDKVVLGYYTSWSPPTNLDANKITHLNYSFGDICWDGEHGNPRNEQIPAGQDSVWPCTDLDGKENTELPNGTIVMYEPETDLGELRKVAALKQDNPNLKTLYSIGG